MQEFIAYAKANPGRLTYASGGHGTSLHLAGELFQRMAGIEMTHVPYRGAAPAFNDLIPGRVDVMFATAAGAAADARGKLRGLAVTTEPARRGGAGMPTIAESGVPGFEVSSWFGILRPGQDAARDRREDQRRHGRGAAPILRSRRNWKQLGVMAIGSTPGRALRAFLKSEMDKWGPVIGEAHIRPK